MARRGPDRRGRSRPVPKELRPVIGGVVLVATVRAVDAVWRRVTGRPTPVEDPVETPVEAATDATDPAGAVDPSVVRDRLLYATLLGGALRLARRMGLPKDGAGGGPNGRSPA